MAPKSNTLWRVRFDFDACEADLRPASQAARSHTERWRLRIEIAGGIPT
jgi:hypothetical protein